MEVGVLLAFELVFKIKQSIMLILIWQDHDQEALVLVNSVPSVHHMVLRHVDRTTIIEQRLHLIHVFCAADEESYVGQTGQAHLYDAGAQC